MPTFGGRPDVLLPDLTRLLLVLCLRLRLWGFRFFPLLLQGMLQEPDMLVHRLPQSLVRPPIALKLSYP